MTTTVRVGGLSFSDPASRDADGCLWVLSKLSGWDDGAGVRSQATERPNAHGSFAERGWRGGRTPVIDGYVVCPSRSLAAAAKRSLSAVLAGGDFGDFEVDDVDDGSLTAAVQLGAEPTVEWMGSNKVAVRYQGIFYAPDPLRYGTLAATSTTFPDRQGGLRFPLYSDGDGNATAGRYYGDLGSAGTLSLSNEGTADSWPQFEVAGPVDASGFEIVGSGTRLVYEGAVPAGSFLVIDTATGTVVMDGNSDRTLSWAEFSPVPAGGSAEWSFVALGSRTDAVLTATFRPAFW